MGEREELENIAIVYDKIREKVRSKEKGKDKALAVEFDRHLKEEMIRLSTHLGGNTHPLLKNAHVLKAKASLY